jgi:ABC-type transporter Mla subunit MlaD
MAKKVTSIVSTTPKPKLGDRIRGIADQLRQETGVQIKATSRILGAAAQLAERHDQLIDAVVDMVEQDLDQQLQERSPTHTVEQLQQQFKTLKQAKDHFGVKASSWATLVTKLNAESGRNSPPNSQAEGPFLQRLESLEIEVKEMRADLAQIHAVMKDIVELLSSSR